MLIVKNWIFIHRSTLKNNLFWNKEIKKYVGIEKVKNSKNIFLLTKMLCDTT